MDAHVIVEAVKDTETETSSNLLRAAEGCAIHCQSTRLPRATHSPVGIAAMQHGVIGEIGRAAPHLALVACSNAAEVWREKQMTVASLWKAMWRNLYLAMGNLFGHVRHRPALSVSHGD